MWSQQGSGHQENLQDVETAVWVTCLGEGLQVGVQVKQPLIRGHVLTGHGFRFPRLPTGSPGLSMLVIQVPKLSGMRGQH